MVTRHEGSQCVDNESYIALSEPDWATLNMKLKQVRLPTNTDTFFMKIIFIYSYKTIEEYYIVIYWQITNLKTSF